MAFLSPLADTSVHYSQHSYHQMTSFLQEQASKCPNITKLTTIGTSQGGKLIYSLEITEDVGLAQRKPHVGLVGSLQGTDIVGKELLLKLVEHLCSAYRQKEASITNKRNKSKFPTWRMQTSGLFIKRDRGFELGTTGKQIPLVTGWRP